MTLSRREAIDFLHEEKGYSRRMSAKLVDVAIQYDGALSGALQKALERKLSNKSKVKVEKKIRHVVSNPNAKLEKVKQ